MKKCLQKTTVIANIWCLILIYIFNFLQTFLISCDLIFNCLISCPLESQWSSFHFGRLHISYLKAKISVFYLNENCYRTHLVFLQKCGFLVQESGVRSERNKIGKKSRKIPLASHTSPPSPSIEVAVSTQLASYGGTALTAVSFSRCIMGDSNPQKSAPLIFRSSCGGLKPSIFFSAPAKCWKLIAS